MKTFKIICQVLAIVALSTLKSVAQDIYINAGVGYNMSAGKQLIGINSTETSYEGVYGSLGKGVGFGVGVGYMFNEHIGIELGISALSGSKYKGTDASDYSSSTATLKASIKRFTPAVKITMGESVKPYAKFGMVLGVGAKTEVEESGSEYNGPIVGWESFSNEYKYSGGAAIGWLGAFGLDIKASDAIAIFVELNSINQNWAPKQVESTETDSSGSINETITFDDTVSDNSDKELKEYLPFSSIGINAGIKLILGSK